MFKFFAQSQLNHSHNYYKNNKKGYVSLHVIYLYIYILQKYN